MTADQIKLAQQSFARVVNISATAAEQFYGRLCEVAPQPRAKFLEDMSAQRMKLMATLATVVNGLSDLPTILAAASVLAKRHVDYRVQASHYPVAGEIESWTLKRPR
jgi:nitric oxide dioxygenase